MNADLDCACLPVGRDCGMNVLTIFNLGLIPHSEFRVPHLLEEFA
jgi:hypothetical protein